MWWLLIALLLLTPKAALAQQQGTYNQYNRAGLGATLGLEVVSSTFGMWHPHFPFTSEVTYTLPIGLRFGGSMALDWLNYGRGGFDFGGDPLLTKIGPTIGYTEGPDVLSSNSVDLGLMFASASKGREAGLRTFEVLYNRVMPFVIFRAVIDAGKRNDTTVEPVLMLRISKLIPGLSHGALGVGLVLSDIKGSEWQDNVRPTFRFEGFIF